MREKKQPCKTGGNSCLFTILFLGLSCFLSQPSFAQDKVEIRLTTPPPNQLGLKDLWNITLRNKTSKDLKLYLTGQASEAKEGKIVEGKSNVFTLPPGERKYRYDDFKNGSVSWKNRKYEDIIIRTGNAPSGNYTFCVTAFSEDGEVAGQEQCMDQEVSLGSDQEITLIQPGEGDKIDLKNGLIFMWTPLTPAPRDGYSLKLVEVVGSQSAEAALKTNKVVLNQSSIRTTSFQYPSTAQKLKAGGKYAWQVSSNDPAATSQAGSFMMATGGCIGHFKIDSAKCIGVKDGKSIYRMCVTYKADINNPCNIFFNDPQNASYNLALPASNINNILYSFTAGTSLANFSPALGSLPASLAPGASVSVCFDLTAPNATTSVKVGAFGLCNDGMQSTLHNTGNDLDSFKLKPCDCDPCQDMKVTISKDSLQLPKNGNPSQINLVGTFGNLNNVLIRKVSAEIIYFNIQQTNDKECAKCVFDSKQYGNFLLPGSALPGYNGPVLNQPDYSHLITWTSTIVKDCGSGSGTGTDHGDPNNPVGVSGKSAEQKQMQPGQTMNQVIGTGPGTGIPKTPDFILPISVPDANALSCCGDVIRICVRYTFYDFCCHTCEVIKCYQIKRGK